jgi:hypothetical protein
LLPGALSHTELRPRVYVAVVSMEKCFKEPFSLVDKVVKVVAQSVNHLETSRLFPPFIHNTYYCLRWAYF